MNICTFIDALAEHKLFKEIENMHIAHKGSSLEEVYLEICGVGLVILPSRDLDLGNFDVKFLIGRSDGRKYNLNLDKVNHIKDKLTKVFDYINCNSRKPVRLFFE